VLPGAGEDVWEDSASGVLEVVMHRIAVEFFHALEERRRLEERDLNNDADMTVEQMLPGLFAPSKVGKLST
jgi:hypothetical protein